MAKRIILTNETPNDQGGIIYNNTVDWSRFSSNPIMLYHHGHDPEVRDIPIGHWEDLQFDGENWSAVPIFSNIPEAQKFKTLYEEGNLKASSIGGICIKATTGRYGTDKEGNKVPELRLNKDGYWESVYFLVYEASLTPIGSNMDALTLNSAYFYNADEILTEEEILTLNSKVNMKKDEQKPIEGEVTDLEKDKEQPKVEEKEKTEIPPVQQPVILESDQLEKVETSIVDKVIAGIKSFFAANPYHEEPDGDEPVKVKPLDQVENPSAPTEKAETVMEQAEDKDEMAVKDESEMMCKVESCQNEAELQAVEAEFESELPQVIKDAINKKKESFTLSSKIPQMKTPEEMKKEGVELATVKQQVKLGAESVPTFTELRSKEDGQRVITRVLNSGGKSKIAEDHRVVLHSILKDERYKAIVEKISFSDKSGNRSIPKASLVDLATRFDGNQIDFMNFKSGKLQNYAEFDATDDLLASPDLIAVEWLSIFLFALFPSGQWKSEIPTFAAQMTSKNKGLIYTNINADPAVYQGSRPNNPAIYEYDDLAVSLTMSPFYLQPMLWQPLKMALLRYDQQATGWAQAMMKFNTTIDNYLIYTLASLIPAASVVKTSGGSFSINASTDPDSFLLNPAFVGALGKPKLDDILKQSQIFKKQNFEEGTKYVTVMDPTMDRYITADPETKSLLTRFVNSEGNELVSYKDAKLRTRSKVALYNPATSAVIDPAGVVPAGAVSAGMSFIPDQVGIGIGNLDVFMVQNPAMYGYEMSADIRAGAALMRQGGQGIILYTYGEPQN